jgi:ribosomal-protein-alanine N-acetyltransferase
VKAKLRAAGLEDVAALATLHANSFPQSWAGSELAELLSTGGGFCLLVEGTTGLQGFVLGRALADEAEILTIAVDPAWRRRGLGAALVEAASSFAHETGARALFLEVAVDNPAGLALYEHLGFERAGFRPGYYHRAKGERVDAFVLRRDLTA